MNGDDKLAAWRASRMPVRQNLRFALRTLRRNPGFAVTAVGTLALGISVNTTIFSVVNAVLLQPLPYPDAGRLVLLWTTNPQRNAFERSTGYLNVQDWRNNAVPFEAMAYFRDEPAGSDGRTRTGTLDAAFVSPDFFSLLGIQPVLGRSFTNREAERGEPLLCLAMGSGSDVSPDRRRDWQSPAHRGAADNSGRRDAPGLPAPVADDPDLDAAHFRQFLRFDSHRTRFEIRLGCPRQTPAGHTFGAGPS